MSSIQNTSECHTAERAVPRAQCARGARQSNFVFYILQKL